MGMSIESMLTEIENFKKQIVEYFIVSQGLKGTPEEKLIFKKIEDLKQAVQDVNKGK